MADTDKASILIVDSSVGFATMLQESLEQDNGYHAAVAHTGSEALSVAASETFDMAIVDLGLDAADPYIEVTPGNPGGSGAHQAHADVPSRHVGLRAGPVVANRLNVGGRIVKGPGTVAVVGAG